MSQQGSWHPMFDLLSHPEVVWDEELQQLDGEMDDPLECKHAMFKAPIMSNSVVQGVFDELSSKVVWDDEFLQGVESQDSLLELLAHGECSIGMDNKPTAEPVSFKAPVAGEWFDENPMWDEDPQFDTEPPDDMILDVDHVVEPLIKDFQVLPNVKGSAHEKENFTEIILVLCNDALWDDKVAGLSLFQEFDTKVADTISIPYAFSLDILTQDSGIHALDLGVNACTTTLNIELGMDVVDTVFDETPPELFVRAAGFLSDVCAANGLLNGMLYQDVLWDDELLHGIHDPEGLLQQLDSELGELMQGKQVSVEIFCESMSWDAIPADSDTHHNLLQRLAQSGDYCVCEEKPTAEPHTYDVLTHVSGSFCLLELGIEAVPEFDEIHLEDKHGIMSKFVQFMDPVTSKGDVQEASDGTCPEGRATSLAENVTFFYTSELSECAAVEMFNEVSLGDVIWDKEVQHSPNSHGLLPHEVVCDETSTMSMHSDLLQQLAFGSKSTGCIVTHSNQVGFKALIVLVGAAHPLFDGMCLKITWDVEMQSGISMHEGLLEQLALDKGYMDEEKITHMVELNANEVLTHVGDKMHANLGMDGDCTSELDTHASLLQQLAWHRVVFDYEMGKSITEQVLGDVLTYAGSSTVTIDSDMQLSDQVCKSQLFVDAYLIEVKHKEAFISMSPWDPGIWSYLVMGLTLRLERMDFSDIFSFANQVMVQAAINPGLSNTRLVMHSNILEKSVWELNIEQGQKGANQELNYDSENLIIWELMQGYDELTPWRLNALSPQHYNTEIASSQFSPWSKRTPAHKQQQLEIYRMLERQWDPDNMGKMEFSFLLDGYLIDLLHKGTHVSFRQWDPGIIQWTGYEYNCCSGSFWIQNFDVSCKQFLNTTAWGQAVFCGGGNVIPSNTMDYAQGEPWAGKPICRCHSPNTSPGLKLQKSNHTHIRRHRTKYTTEHGQREGSDSSSSVSRSSFSDYPCDCSRRRFDLVGGHGCDSVAGERKV